MSGPNDPGLEAPPPSLRDYFAAAALTGYLAMHADPTVMAPKDGHAAEAAYKYADAMLAQRQRGQP